MRSKALHILSILILTVGMATTARAQIKILGNVYGGGDQAAVQGNTHIEINKGLYGGEIFGGGNGALNGDGTVNKSADVNSTTVTINGGKFIVEQLAGNPATVKEAGKLTNNHNVFGGGNLACNVSGSTNVNIYTGLLPVEFFKVDITDPDNPTSMYRRWGEYVGRIEGMTAAKAPGTPEKLVQGSVFGAGYGVHTDVAGTTNVTIAIGDEETINAPADILTRYAYAKRGGDTSGEHLASKFVITAFGGGYDGTAENTNVEISGSPFLQNVFGGGLGSKAGAKQKNPSAAYASTVGTVNGGTNVNITGATIYGNVYGGGAGIFGEIEATTAHGTARMPYYKAAMVMKETNLEISGGTLVFGNVYGGGDIANTGWFEDGYRPSASHQNYVNESQAHLDLTTYLQMKGGNVMGNVFAGGNGRKMTELEKANFIGAIIGNTSVVLGNYNSGTSVWDAGTKIWGSVYGGGQNGSVYSCAAMAANNGGVARTLATGLIDGCTNVEFKHTDIGQDIFGGGLGAVEMVDHDHNPATPEQEVITSADISGNTFVFFNRGNLITGSYWDPQDCVFKEQKCGEYVEDEVKVNYRDTDSDIAHNLYGGGNMACTIGTKDRNTGKLVEGTGNTTVYMIGAPVVDPSFMGSKYYTDALAIYGKPHFSAFGAGYGKYAKVLGNANSDIALVAAGFHSVVGGGMNGPVEGECYTHIACDKDNTRIHNVYGGGYYAPVGGTHLQITEGYILENVFGGGVMGNIAPNNEDMTAAVTSTVIGLKKEGDGSNYTLYGVDGTSVIREYEYDGNKIIIDGNVYGGNDVSGTVNGVASLTLYGGTVKSNVHGAGNGNHVGYYVPGILKYDKGEHGDDNYFYVDHTADGGPKGNTYVGRPQTIGGVNLTLEGNTKDERVTVLGQVFGGGNSCTIGEWNKNLLTTTYAGNPHLVRDDPAYFKGGGTLDINLGSHVTIGRTHEQLAKDTDGEIYIDNEENVSGLFMGCSGRELATQTGAYTVDNRYHHFFDYNAKQYYPGFAVGTEAGVPMSREQQLLPFQAYLNNIMVWSDAVHLNIPDAAEDIWLANFVGGGFRGSMRAKTIDGKFDYTLPEGVTVSHTIVGGAYNAHVKYHYFATDGDGNFVDADHDGKYDYATTVPTGWTKVDPDDPDAGGDYIELLYEDKDHPEQVTGILRYNFNGGMLSENSTGVNSSDVGLHIHKVHADPRSNPAEYATAYFEPINEGDDGAEPQTTRDKLFSANRDKALLHLTLKCALEPEVLPKGDGSGENYAHGGNVFGGCFMSGFVEGDSWVDYHCWLAPKCANSTEEKYKYFFSKTDNMHIYDDAGDLDTNNALSVYGAGYGTDTHSDGDVYLYIKSIAHTALGDVDPAGMFPYIFNAFGGSNMGTVAGNTNVYYAVGRQGTLLGSLYGGGFKGVIEGNTFVEMAEGFAHNVYGGSRQADIHGASHVWAYDGKARGIDDANHLIICNLYGGNDIAGSISGTMPAKFTEAKWNASPTGPGTSRPALTDKRFNTYVEISADDESADRGFPLVGSAFAGGNGEAWVSEVESGAKPEVATALIEIDGGSTLRAFGGGNMATVTGDTYIFADARSNNFADVTFTEYQKNIVTKVFFSGMKTGFKWDDTRLTIDPFHVVRLFGGNNLATMDIQPTWNLKCGKIENVYSGGNMGDMTYYNPAGKPATTDGKIGSPAGVETLNADGSNSNYTPRGLSITIDQPDIYINSLFGGCRMSDVIPTPKGGQEAWPEGTDGEDFYGATVNITDGYIENVYGGNDVSGNVQHGTNVNISGAVSGNVYGSGNGFYLYKYDTTVSEVTEDINDEYGIFYRVPERNSNKELYDVMGVEGTDTHKLLTINAVRPSVEKAFLNIAGLEHYPAGAGNPKRVAYVKGNVFCGGNASTITGVESFSKFKIGSYVTLNGVFMGSDGKAFTENNEIARFARINGFTDMGANTEFKTGYELDAQHNPILLNTYMMAVDMKAQPKDFNLNLPLKEAHIGTYCGGGNRGSMLVDKTVELPFHHDIIIYDKIVAACLDANVEFNDGKKKIYSMGGYTRKISDNATYGNKKFKLDIASQFVPLVMDVPADKNSVNSHDETFDEAIAHGFLYDNRQKGVKYTYEEFNKLFETEYEDQETFEHTEGADHIWKIADGIYAPSCNIYGGCYQSGEVEGDVELNLYSNMLRYVNKEALDKSIANNIPCFNVYGAGFGQNSHVWGNVTINMDRSLDTSTMGDPVANSNLSDEIATLLGGASKWDIQHSTTLAENMLGIANAYQYPSFNNVIGGGRNGKLIGNTTVEIRNGLVYTDVAGGCYASDMYGSTQVIVGYPKYYKCLTTGKYGLDRADKWNTDRLDGDGNKVIKQSVWYLKGDLVPDNVYQQITDASKSTKFVLVDVQPVDGKNTSTHTVKGVYDGTTWNDVNIKIGKGIYGGGYSLENSMAASAGSVTTYKLLDDEPTITDIYPHNFSGRYGYDELTFAGYGGNSSVMLGDQEGGEHDHIRVSTLKATVASIPPTSSVIGKFIKETVDGKEVYTHLGDKNPDPHETYYTLTGDGGIYGDGHLTFCEGFRSADVTRYGWADGTAKHPILMNTFQRMDLLSVNDCCLMLQGAQDFATDQIDATIYSITRINELRMNSSLDANSSLGQISAFSGSGEGTNFDMAKQRNYLAFFNNVHYLGSIVTNDPFVSGFHNNQGMTTSDTYFGKKLEFITNYTNSTPDGEGHKTAEATTTFKQRNVATARNAIGINNGYCLRIQNQEYEGTGASKMSKTYYGPIVGVCEVKLLTLVQGEGGGYVYADNIHEYTGTPGGEDHFLMTSGNFVFPGIIDQGVDGNGTPIGDQYIVDDCFVTHFGSPGNITTRSEASKPHLDEAHYWYVEGNKYFFTTTLTGFTYKHKLDFDLIKTDPNVVLSGMENGSSLNIKKIEWLSTHRNNYDPVLPSTAKETDDEGNEIDKISDYEFDIYVGGNDITDWHNDMPRYSTMTQPYTTSKTIENDHLPQFNIRLQDKLDNSGDAAYKNHLDEPELVKIYFEGKTTDANGVEMTYEYTITVNIVYLQGPTVTGGVTIENCALPGELIGFSTSGLKVKTPELMPITAASWQILPLSEIDEHGEWKWDLDRGIIIPKSSYEEATDDENNTIVTGTIPAYYKQNEYTIAYIFTAGGYDFPVMPEQTVTIPKENRMIVVHNYHRMKDIVARDLQIETMPSNIPDNQAHTYHPKFAEAKIYIEDEDDLRAFVDYLNMATEGNVANIPVGLTGLDVILQKNITLTSALPAITQKFAGNFHGDGYHIDLGESGTSFFGSNLTGEVYNLGLINGTSIASTGSVVNSYIYEDNDDFAYGQKAYDLSHTFNPTTDHNDYADYVANYYANGDYQYATTDRVWSLRTAAPNYGYKETKHDTEHTHDDARWKDTDDDGEADTNVPLYDGTLTVADHTVDISGNGTEYFTYRGLPENYANDYLFFGQHLDKTNADAYPVHIDGKANGDADYAKGGNRVYKTSGFYGSAADNGFYYNKDAWALQPTLSAIDFTFRNGDENNNDWTKVSGRYKEGDDTSTGGVTNETNQPLAFHVDSNADYNGGTYDNTSYGHVTQNLIVVGENATENATQASVLAAGNYGDNTPEKDIRYHRVQLKNGEIHQYEIDYFHLVDKQDFNSPISPTVNSRAWYERYPQAYRNVTPSPSEPTYQTPSAWEGLVLPFQYVEKVSGEPQKIKGHIYANALSHFYGETTPEMDADPALNDRTLHHEYWLTGLVAGDGDKATFARPTGTEGTGNFYIVGSSWNFTYENEYYRNLPDYDDHYDTRDDEGADIMGEHSNAWYALPHTFALYPRQFQSTPYLCAFPGDDFYEFSLEGQKITFEKVGKSIIAVTDVDMTNYGTTTVGTHRHVGTYTHVTANAQHLGINTAGTAFDVQTGYILPFRTYMTTTASPSPRRIVISDGGQGRIDVPDDEDINIGDLTEPTLLIYGEGTTIVVESNYDTTLRIYTPAGRLTKTVDVTTGINRYEGFTPNVYIVGGKKIRLMEGM